MTELFYRSARDQLAQLASGSVTAQELLDLHLSRMNTLNTRINAVVKTDVERARHRAAELDALHASGQTAGPLHGLPLTIKDTFDVDGMPAVAGAPKYASRAPQVADAAVVERLKAAGAVVWGKTNVPYLAGDWQSFNRVYGTTCNPFDPNRSPGGSSGGAAAALACGFTALEVGSDIGGSLRTPAHFSGVCSLKPSYGVVDQSGHIPPNPGSDAIVDLNVVGPMARNVADLKLLFEVLTGTRDTCGELRPNDLRLAVWSREDSFPLSRTCEKSLLGFADLARSNGVAVSGAKPDIDGADLLETYLKLLIPIVAMDFPPTLRSALRLLRPWFQLQRRLGAGPLTRANWGLQAHISHRDWLLTDEHRNRLKRQVHDFLGNWDAILAPVTPTPAFPRNEAGDVISRRLDVDSVAVPYASHLTWIALATVCHLPAAVIPVGQTEDGLPLGVQIIGAEGDDWKVLAIADALERLTGGFTAPPLDGTLPPVE